MSYSFQFSGDAGTVAEQFDDERDKCASYGMLKVEQNDIDKAGDFAVSIASTHGNVTGSCSGHWSIYGKDDPKNEFQRISITIDAAPTKEGE